MSHSSLSRLFINWALCERRKWLESAYTLVAEEERPNRMETRFAGFNRLLKKPLIVTLNLFQGL